MGDPLPRSAASHPSRRSAGPAALVFAAVIACMVACQGGSTSPSTAAAVPPVLAGQQLWGSCAAGFYARHGDTIVLTSSAHCAAEGTTATDPDGTGVRGMFGPGALLDPCPHPERTCRPSDMNYLVVAPDRIPWGRLNVVDMGDGGERVLEAGMAPLSCADMQIGDAVEINGRDIFRRGDVTEKGGYLPDPAADRDYFPCMVVAADVHVEVGDSGGAVLVRGLPAGVSSRSFDGVLGFTPIAEGLEALGLELCTTPDCGLSPS